MKIFTKLLTSIAALGLVAMVVMPTYAEKSGKVQGPHEKATGSVTWSARNGLLPGIVTTFDAHDLGEGQVDRGTVETYRPADEVDQFPGGNLTIDVKCVKVEGNTAWFGGVATVATGGYSPYLGHPYIYWVQDNGTPGSEGDLIGSQRYSTLEQVCGMVENGSWTGTGIVTDGNLVVHSIPENAMPEVLMGNHEEQQGQPEETPKGPDPKVDVCHHTEGVNEYLLINISENALASHLEHGDYLPGDPYPGMENAVFADDCSAELLCSIYTINVDSVNGNTSYWHDYEITACPGDELVGEWLDGTAGTEIVTDITLYEDIYDIAFKAEYESNGYEWYPAFMLNDNNTLSFVDGYGSDNVTAAMGTWSVIYE